MTVPDRPPSLHQQPKILAWLERAHIKKVGTFAACPICRPEPGGRRQRYGRHAVGMNAKMFDRLLPHSLAVGDDHRGDAQLDQRRSPPAYPAGGVVPGPVHPWREIMER